MAFPIKEAYGLPTNVKSLVGSVLKSFCESKFPVHMVVVEVTSQRILIDTSFLVPKGVRLVHMSRHSHKK